MDDPDDLMPPAGNGTSCAELAGTIFTPAANAYQHLTKVLVDRSAEGDGCCRRNV